MCFALSYYVYLHSEFRVVMSMTISAYKTKENKSKPQHNMDTTTLEYK
jgi:hypothetical protein